MPQTIALHDGLLIDGTGRHPVAGATVLVEETRIVRAGRRLRIPRDARVLDVGGRTIMPGLTDAHVHLGITDLGPEALAAQPRFPSCPPVTAQATIAPSATDISNMTVGPAYANAYRGR